MERARTGLAPPVLNIGLGHGHVGDDEADVDPLGFGLPLAMRALGDDGDGECGSRDKIEDAGGGGRLGNLM